MGVWFHDNFRDFNFYENWKIWLVHLNLLFLFYTFCSPFSRPGSCSFIQLQDQYVGTWAIQSSNDTLEKSSEKDLIIYTHYPHSNVWWHTEKANGYITSCQVVCFVCIFVSNVYANGFYIHTHALYMLVYSPISFSDGCRSVLYVDWLSLCLTPLCLCSQVCLPRSGPFL